MKTEICPITGEPCTQNCSPGVCEIDAQQVAATVLHVVLPRASQRKVSQEIQAKGAGVKRRAMQLITAELSA